MFLRRFQNPDYYTTGKTIAKQKIDIEISIKVTQYVTLEYRNRSTGRRIHATFPDGFVNDVTYGGSVKVFEFVLNNYCNVSIDKTQNMLTEMTDGKIRISKGMINGLSSEFSVYMEERQKMYVNLLKARVMYSDATNVRVNGKGTYVVICAKTKR